MSDDQELEEAREYPDGASLHGGLIGAPRLLRPREVTARARHAAREGRVRASREDEGSREEDVEAGGADQVAEVLVQPDHDPLGDPRFVPRARARQLRRHDSGRDAKDRGSRRAHRRGEPTPLRRATASAA